ncbi:MAG: hypothetical protein K9J13_13210 [Saprospiraceae bacterium]|nr:hypothetical protein [Saprospiraceae bacterium]
MTNKLHKIFSETGCLSDEVLHKYLMNELSKEEKHLVEKHLVDCEICSDVLEGMSLVGDYKSVATIITDINSDIKSYIEKPKPKSRVIKLNSWIPYVAAAAILLFIISIFYLRQDLNENQIIVAEKAIGEGEPTVNFEDSLTVTKEGIAEPIEGSYTINDLENIDGDDEIKAVQKEFVFDSKQAKDDKHIVVNDIMAEEIEISKDVIDETVVTSGATGKGNTITSYTADATYQPQSDFTVNTKTPKKEQNLTAVSVDEVQNVQVISTQGKKSLLNKTEDSKKKKVTKQKTSKNKASSAQAPKFEDAETKSKKPEIYDKGIVSQNEGISISDSISNNYLWTENQNSSYNQGYLNYSSNNYKAAIGLFNVVLADSINHYNSLYYGGVSYYQLNKNDSALVYFNKVLEVEKGSFHEDAMWYKALILKRKNKIPEAKLLLQSIINENGKYKIQANEMLKQLN